MRWIVFAALALGAAGCASLPPGAEQSRTLSAAFAPPVATRLGRQAEALAKAHPGLTGARLFARGVDGLVLRAQMIAAAQRSVDIQYFIFVEDYTGKVLLDAVLKAAERGVRVRLLIDDLNLHGRSGTRETLAALDRHRNIEIRVFNPFAYRGDSKAIHAVDSLLNASRANHRMHNKLMVADNAVAVVGGRNVADDYFELGAPPKRFGDFDLAVVGQAVPDLSQSFDAFWNCSLAIPQDAVDAAPRGVAQARSGLRNGNAADDLPRLARTIARGEPLASIMAAGRTLAWARARVVADPPRKAEDNAGDGSDSPTAHVLAQRMLAVERELVVISPYFVPGDDGLAALAGLRKKGVRVRVLTNSLASTDVPLVHSAYRKYREPLLADGVELFEVRPAPGQLGGDRKGLGSVASGTPFALHAKAYVFDRVAVLVGSANLDPRSLVLNTEVGLLVESPELAAQIVSRFDEFAASENSYRVTREEGGLHWTATVGGRAVAWSEEPETTAEQRLKVEMLSILPLEPLL